MSRTPKKRTFDSLSDAQLQALVEKHGSIRKAAQAQGFAYVTLRDELARRGLQSPAGKLLAKVKDRSDIQLRPADANIVREAGYDPDLWEVGGISVSETETETGSVYSTSTRLKPRKNRARPATPVEPTPTAPVRKTGKTQTIVVLSDHHAPLHDEELHQTSLDIIREIKPDAVLMLGDLLDLSGGVSRHADQDNGADIPDPNECIQAGYQILCDIRHALGPKKRMLFLEGNHDVRIGRKIANEASPLKGLRIGGTDVNPYSLDHLLRFDELDVEMVRHHGLTYPLAFMEVVPDDRMNAGLVALHGVRARKGTGQSALATAKDRGHGVIMGHCHRLGAVSFNQWTTDGQKRKVHAIEAGAIARTDSTGLGYAPIESNDQASGFVVLTIFEDNTIHPEIVSWENDQAIFRNQIWSQKKRAKRAA